MHTGEWNQVARYFVQIHVQLTALFKGLLSVSITPGIALSR